MKDKAGTAGHQAAPPDYRAIIARLRDGGGLSAQAACEFASGLASGAVEDAQAAAFSMAVLLRGLDASGRVALTLAMRDSGAVLDWDLPGPVVDKHSTGGVGDCVSLVLAPALAACGGHVPMISGRGLGHTGGTLDKLESIPGYQVEIDDVRLENILRDVGCAIISPTAALAPADRRLYAIRDVTATVESVDLITASILAKKLAEGLDALVLDVKCGSGAFMPDLAAARELAQALVTTANGAGCPASALITDMGSPLASAAGNALEVIEAIAVLAGNRTTAGHDRLYEVSCALGGEVLAKAGLADDAVTGHKRVADSIGSGAAAERFARMVAAQGGPADLIERADTYLRPAPVIRHLQLAGGRISHIDTRLLGEIVVRLGGGRLRQGQAIDHAVGLSNLPCVGDGATVLAIHARNGADADAACQQLQRVFRFGLAPDLPRPLILDKITA